MEATNIGYLEETPGQKSVNRLVFLIGFIWLMLLTAFIVYLKAFQKLEVTWTELSLFFGGTATIFSGLKLGSKALENKSHVQ